MIQPLKIGIAGFGQAAKVMHAPFLSSMEEYKLVSVLERHNNDSQQRYPYVKMVRTFDELIELPDIEIIVITTPNNTHFDYAKRGLLAGKHIVLEKPFTITSDDAKNLIEVSQKANRVLSVFQNRRYVCDFLTIRKILAENLLGPVVEFEAHYDRYRPGPKPNAWRERNEPGSGILYDLGSHLIDQALFLFGIPKTINADVRKQRPHAKIDDYFDLSLDYGFTKVILKSGMLVREPGPRYMVHGTIGSYIKSGEDPQEELLKAGAIPNSPDWGKEAEENWGVLHTEINNKIIRERYPSLHGNFGLYYKNLYETIRNNQPLKEKAEHGYNTIRMIELALESHQKKCTVECSGFISLNYE
ncbi:MAG TPA: oxidoreductase [Puia sp.]|nr:oxidoreductase [Puia sp.]